MKLKEYAPESVVVAPELRARKGPPDPANVQRIAESIAANGQLQPGVVREEDGKFSLVIGEHRLEACKLLNGMLAAGDEPFKFYAVAVKANDEKALIDAIVENEFRVATDVFDRCVSMQRLTDMGKSQSEVAKIFDVSEATVTQTLKAGKLPVKYQKMVKNGDMTQDAALLIADIEDKTLQAEVAEAALAYAQQMAELEDRAEKRRQEKAAAAEAAAAEKAAAEAEARGEKAPAPAKKKASAKKEPPKKSKPKVTKEAVKAGKKQKGLSNEPVPVSKSKFIATMEALGEDPEIPQSARDLMGRIEGYLDGEYTVTQLANSFKRNCIADGKKAA